MLEILEGVTAFVIALLSFRLWRSSRSAKPRKSGEEIWIENVMGKDASKFVPTETVRLSADHLAKYLERLRNDAAHFPADDIGKYLEKVSLNYDEELAVMIDKMGRIKMARRKRQPIRIDYSATWNLLGFLFSHKMRKEIYTPVIEELKEDLLIARTKCRTRMQRRWVQMCFLLRTFGVLLACFRVATGRLLGRAIPNTIRQWFSLMR